MEYGTLVVDASRRTARDDEPTPFFLCVCRGQLSVRYPLQTGLSADVQLVDCREQHLSISARLQLHASKSPAVVCGQLSAAAAGGSSSIETPFEQVRVCLMCVFFAAPLARR
jgi:hypothetical protein